MNSTLTKFRCWQNLNQKFDLEIEGNSLYVKIEVPNLFKWVQIINGNNKIIASKVYFTSQCRIRLPQVSPGKYYFFLYVSDNGISFDGYIGGRQVILNCGPNKCWSFILPEFALWNKNLIKQNKLKYMLDSTLIPNSKTMISKTLSLTANCVSLREKVLTIHDFIAKNLFYDYDSLANSNTNRSVEQIVSSKKCVCQGFADMALVMLQSIGIESQNILCYAIKDIYNHGWSETTNKTSDLNHVITRAKLEDRWLYMDVTWDSNNAYENGKYIKGKKPSHRYFDVTIPFLSSTHRFFEE